MTASRQLFAALCSFAVAGCTIVNIEGTPGGVQVHGGVLKIVPADRPELIAYESEGFGLVPGLNGATLGYQKETVAMAYVPERCQVVVFRLPETEAGLRLWRQITEQTSHFCILGEKNREVEHP